MADKPTLKSKFRSRVKQEQNMQTLAAEENLLQELFNDMYSNRHRVYWLNFMRGIFFGLGSVLGATIVIAVLIWLLSLFIDFPLIGDYVEALKQTIVQQK